MENIRMIRTDEIYPHPQNPRKDLGDLTELTASIKASGIFQNLTVIEEESGKYTVIIGHRRLAAAKAAGLEEVPCVVVEMSEQEQLQTMLTENMQRSDLTIIEQAEGIQMVLDLGITEAELTQRTGLSKSTIRRRVKLLKLDREELEKAQMRGGTIKDYLELDRIKDTTRKNEVLKAIGTQNFNYKLNQAIEEEELIKFGEKAKKEIETFATQITEEEAEDKRFIGQFGRWRRELYIPEDKDETRYFYTVYGEGTPDQRLSLYRELNPVEIMEDDDEEYEEPEEEKWLDRVIKEDEARAEQFLALRKKFVEEYPEKKIGAHIETLIKKILTGEDRRIIEDAYELMGIEVDDQGYRSEPNEEELDEYIEKHPARALFLTVWGKAERKVNLLRWEEEYDEDENTLYSIESNFYYGKSLDEMYEFLEEFGYEMCDEEKAYLNGTTLQAIREEFRSRFPGKLYIAEGE